MKQPLRDRSHWFQSQGRRAALFAALALCAALAAYWQWNRWGQPGQAAAVANIPPPAVTASPFLNTRTEAHYVGSAACRECHHERHASFLETAHSRSFNLVDPAQEPPDAVFHHSLSGRRYRSYRDGGQLRHRESLALPDEREVELHDHTLKYLVGSGRFSRTYLAEVDGFLVESPLTWYAALDNWGMSPGYDHAVHESFHRGVGFECLYCHVGHAEPADGTLNRVRIHELSIGCERCHGPGSLHVARRQTGVELAAGETDFSIVNPRHLARELSESICQQCHLESVAGVMVRGRRHGQFRPGLRWSEFFVNFGYETSPGDMTVTGHVEQLRQSRCYQATETMTCVSCHDPHDSPSAAERVAYYRNACVNCHQDPSACGMELAQRIEKNGDDCAACHMPNSSTEIPHIAFTHHRIAIHDEFSSTSNTAEARPLAAVLDMAHFPQLEQRRMLGLAYASLYLEDASNEHLQPYRARAKELLLEVVSDGMQDAEVAIALAWLVAGEGDLPAARQIAEQALGNAELRPGDHIRGLDLLSDIAVRENRPSDAIRHLETLVKLRLDPSDWFLLGVCRQQQHLPDEAIRAFQQVLAIDASQPETYRKLAELYERRGDAGRAKDYFEQAAALEGVR